jgi:peptidoglycan hydrolase-like protein with peptidoglycan-binding domain
VVARRTLVDRQSVDGTLGYTGKRAATNRLSGTITWLPRVGAVITPGHTLFRVDGKPVVLMDGTLPAYRSLRTGIADGADVRQLERGLARLGHDPGTVDDHYSAATAAAVRAWQAALGLSKTGRVELGRIVFLPGARRVTELKVSLGSTAATGGGGGDNPNNKFASYTPTQTTPTQTTPTQTTPAPTVTSPYVQTTPATAGASAAAAAQPQARQPRTTARSPSAGAANRDASAAKPISRRSQVAVPPRPDAATMRSALPVRDTGARGGGRPERVLLPAALSLWLVVLAGGALLWRTAHTQRRTGWR